MTAFSKIPEKVKDLFMMIINLVDVRFTGHIEIHFNQGGIGRIKKIEEIK